MVVEDQVFDFCLEAKDVEADVGELVGAHDGLGRVHPLVAQGPAAGLCGGVCGRVVDHRVKVRLLAVLGNVDEDDDAVVEALRG